MRRITGLLPLAPLVFAGVAAAEAIPTHPRQLQLPDPPLALPDPGETRLRLASGTTLHLLEDSTLPLVEVAAALRVGTYLDPPGREGLARLAGAMLRRGGTESLDADAFDERADRLGARLEAGIGETRGGASLSATTNTFPEALALFVEMLARPRFQADRLEAALGNLRESLGRRNDDPLDVLEREWQWLLFGDEHYSTRPPTPRSVEAIGRAELAAFHRRHFRPQDLVLAISGDVRRQELLPRLERLLASWPDAAGSGPAAGWPPPLPTHRPLPGLYLAPADTPQAKVLLGHPASHGEPWSEREETVLGLMSQILGGTDAVSRITGRLRTAEGLVYRAAAHFDTGRPWARDFRVFFEAESRDVPRALALAREEIERLRREPPHPLELRVARSAALGSLRLAFDTAEKVAGWYAEDELLGRPHTFWERRYRALTEADGEQIRRAAERRLRPQELVYLVVGRPGELLAGEPGTSELERAAGHRAVVLPPRDPLTLEPLRAP